MLGRENGLADAWAFAAVRATPRLALTDVRPLVLREALAQRQRTQLRELHKGLLAKYTVTIETPAPDQKPARTTRAERGTR